MPSLFVPFANIIHLYSDIWYVYIVCHNLKPPTNVLYIVRTIHSHLFVCIKFQDHSVRKLSYIGCYEAIVVTFDNTVQHYPNQNEGMIDLYYAVRFQHPQNLAPADNKAMLYYKKTTPNPAILAVHINFPDFHKSVPAI